MKKNSSAISLPQKAAKRRGALTVEFAIVAPLIFMIFLGGLELTALNFVRQTAVNASYEGARKGIVPGGTVTQARTEAVRLLNALGVGNGAVVNVTQTTTQVTVAIEIPARLHSWGLTRFSNGFTIRQSCTLTRE